MTRFLPLLVSVAILAVPGAALAQSDKGTGGKLDTSGKPIPEKCAGLTGEKRQQCIKEHGGKK
jgi:hypothetical protein